MSKFRSHSVVIDRCSVEITQEAYFHGGATVQQKTSTFGQGHETL